MENLGMKYDYENIVIQSVTNHTWFKVASLHMNGHAIIDIVTDIDEFTGDSLLKSFIAKSVSTKNTQIKMVVDNHLAPYETREFKNFLYVNCGDNSSLEIIISNKKIKGRYSTITDCCGGDNLIFSEKTCGTFTNQETPGFVSYKERTLIDVTRKDFVNMYHSGEKL